MTGVQTCALPIYFGSVDEVRFIFDVNKKVFDPLSGKLMQDNINILKTNSQPSSNYPFARTINLNVVGQTVESDGYVDDYSVEVSNVSLDISGSYKDPDYFTYVTGYNIGTFNSRYFVFFQQLIDANLLSRYVLLWAIRSFASFERLISWSFSSLIKFNERQSGSCMLLFYYGKNNRISGDDF